MKNYFLLLALIPLFLFAQVKFEKGYIINNQNEKIECLIKNEDWKNNPTIFEYKISEDSEKLKGDLSTIKEFGVYDEFKYIRQSIALDTSTDVDVKMSSNSDPIFRIQTQFLKVLVEGRASLYEFADGRLNRYFYSIDEAYFIPLVHKKYLVHGNRIATNNNYKLELWKVFKCNTISQEETQKIKYKKNNLMDFFIKFNQCSNVEVKIFENIDKGNINLTLKPGITISSFESNSPQIGQLLINGGNVKFETKISFRLGVEFEYVLPINKNKWSVIIEPSYQHYKSNVQLEFLEIYEDVDREVEMNYNFIELPIGIRHYMFLNDKFKIFVEGMLVTSFGLGDNKLDYNNVNNSELEELYDVELKSSINAAVGLGLQYDRYSLGLRYYTPKNLTMDYSTVDSKYASFLITGGFRLF